MGDHNETTILGATEIKLADDGSVRLLVVPAPLQPAWPPWAWADLPIGARAYASIGGWWERTAEGWKAQSGDTFPTPGGDVARVDVPAVWASLQARTYMPPDADPKHYPGGNRYWTITQWTCADLEEARDKAHAFLTGLSINCLWTVH